MDIKLPTKAVHWPDTGRTAPDGRAILGDPYEFDCRWEDTQEMYVNYKGENETSMAKVFTEEGAGLILIGAVRRGTLDSLEYPSDPFKNQDVWEIRKLNDTPDMEDDWELITAWCGSRGSRHDG